jgi:hypothetical protein
LGLGQADVGDLAAITAVPPECGPLEPVGLAIEEQERELERLDQVDVLELSGRSDGLDDVRSIKRAAEPRIGGPLRRHERMFAYVGP